MSQPYHCQPDHVHDADTDPRIHCEPDHIHDDVDRLAAHYHARLEAVESAGKTPGEALSDVLEEAFQAILDANSQEERAAHKAQAVAIATRLQDSLPAHNPDPNVIVKAAGWVAEDLAKKASKLDSQNLPEASPARLRSGGWGARVQGTIQPGAAIRIVTRKGKEWVAAVDRILWSGKDKRTGQLVTLVTTVNR